MVTVSTHLEIIAEHFLLVFMRVIDFTFLQLKYHIAIRIGWNVRFMIGFIQMSSQKLFNTYIS